MDVHRPDEFVNPVPTLPLRIAVCDSIPRSKWHPWNVLLQNEAGEDVANGVCWNVDPDLVIDMDESLLVMTEWPFKLQSLCVKRKFHVHGCGLCVLCISSKYLSMVSVCTTMTRQIYTTWPSVLYIEGFVKGFVRMKVFGRGYNQTFLPKKNI